MKLKSLVRPLASAVSQLLNDKLFRYMQRTGLVLSVAHTSVEPATGTTYAVSATIPATFDASGYGGVDILLTGEAA